MRVVDSKAWIERRPKRAVLVSSIAALLIGALIGLGLGYKIEHDRTASDVSRLKRSLAATPTTATTNPKAGSSGRTRYDGKVTAVAPGSVTIKSRQGATVTLAITELSAVDKLTKGAWTNLAAGRHVLIAPRGAEILVLRQGTGKGRLLNSVSKTALVMRRAKGLPDDIVKLSDTTVYDVLTSAKVTDVQVGDQLIALGSTRGSFTASEVIIVPASSKFAA